MMVAEKVPPRGPPSGPLLFGDVTMLEYGIRDFSVAVPDGENRDIKENRSGMGYFSKI